MKISICIPQYNRIQLLLKSLRRIEKQSYDHIEICISDDGSSDDTRPILEDLKQDYKYPIKTYYFTSNQGYDRNYRKCIEMASGEYALVIGNDDSMFYDDAITDLVASLENMGFPDIGYTSYVEDSNHDLVINRASSTGIVGSGVDVAIAHYRGFSFVGGIIYKKSVFDEYNTDKHDGSVYSQMYLGLLMIASGANLFTIAEPVVLKDIHFDDGSFRWSYYRDGLPKNWSEYKRMDGGLSSVTNVLGAALEDSQGFLTPDQAIKILGRIYKVNYPFWVNKYKKHGSFAAAWGLVRGSVPARHRIFGNLTRGKKSILYSQYFLSTVLGLLVPVKLFDLLEARLQSVFGKK